jgi:hypothetical protein
MVVCSAAVDSLPEVALVPDQPPEAVQDVAFVEDQVSVEDAPLATVAGFAASDTVTDNGGGDGGGVPDTDCVPDTVRGPTRSPVQLAKARASTGTNSSVFMRNTGIFIA